MLDLLVHAWDGLLEHCTCAGPLPEEVPGPSGDMGGDAQRPRLLRLSVRGTSEEEAAPVTPLAARLQSASAPVSPLSRFAGTPFTPLPDTGGASAASSSEAEVTDAADSEFTFVSHDTPTVPQGEQTAAIEQ